MLLLNLKLLLLGYYKTELLVCSALIDMYLVSIKFMFSVNYFCLFKGRLTNKSYVGNNIYSYISILQFTNLFLESSDKFPEMQSERQSSMVVCGNRNQNIG